MADHQDPCPNPTLQIQLFGPLHLVINGVALPPLRPQKLQGLLALLVLRHPRPLQRSWLAETLWPHSDPDRALFNLRQSLTPLRKALGAAASRLTSPTPQTLALVKEHAGQPMLQTLLWGASTVLREAIDSSRSPVDQESYEQETAQARAVLGQAAFDAAFAEGSAMSLEQAVEFAFDRRELF